MKKLYIFLSLLAISIIPIQIKAYSYVYNEIVVGNGIQPLSANMEVIPITNIGYGEWKVKHFIGIFENSITGALTYEPIVYLENNMTNFPDDVRSINFKIGTPDALLGNYNILNTTEDITNYGGFQYGEFINITANSYMVISFIPKNKSLYDVDIFDYLINHYIPMSDILEHNNLTFDEWNNVNEINFSIILNDLTPPSNYKLHGVTISLLTDFKSVNRITEPVSFLQYQSYFDKFIDSTEITIVAKSIKVNFYNGLQKVATNYIAEGTMFYPPVFESNIDGYEFLGWRAKNGDIIDFNNFILKDRYFTGQEINLSARYYNVLTGNVLERTTPLNAPDFVVNTLDKLGLNNTFGRFLVVIFIIIMVSIPLLVYKAKLFIFVTIYTSLLIMFIIMGMIPLYATIIFILLIILLYTFLIGGNEVSYE